MYIVYKENEIKQLQLKYLLLEMDTVKISEDTTITAHCVISSDDISLDEFSVINKKKSQHIELIKNYKLKNWNKCCDLITVLMGSFKGEMDSFYNILLNRIDELKTTKLDSNWTGVVNLISSEIYKYYKQ